MRVGTLHDNGKWLMAGAASGAADRALSVGLLVDMVDMRMVYSGAHMFISSLNSAANPSYRVGPPRVGPPRLDFEGYLGNAGYEV